MKNFDMDITFHAVSSDQPETSGEVSGNSGPLIKRRRIEYQWEVKERCHICYKNVNEMHENMICHHKYCLACMRKYVESMVIFGGVPKCAHGGCNSELPRDDCEKFLSSKWLQMFVNKCEEAKIADSEKVYCPYPTCSFLMALSSLERCPQSPLSSPSHSSLTTTSTKCQKCYGLFCIECKVPWHTNMSCKDYAPQLATVNAEFNLLAEKNKWRQCPNCKNMIERNEGCMQINCRCGFEFCYGCGTQDEDCNCNDEDEDCNCDDEDDENEDEDEDDM